MFSLDLRLPGQLLENASQFDRLVGELADKATSRSRGSKLPSLVTVFQRYGIPEVLQPEVQRTFEGLCQPYDEDRNHIWGYYIRNLARPVWLSQPGNQVDTLIGNPPWLAYRYMTDELQQRFREMSEDRGLWHGATMAPHQDLSGLFLARVIELYLEIGGQFAFLMPNAALDRAQFAGFRTGSFSKPGRQLVYVQFMRPWDLRRIRPHFFPRGSGVVFGHRVRMEGQRPMPTRALGWAGRIRREARAWREVKNLVEREEVSLRPVEGSVASSYGSRFRQGATIVPRVLFLVDEVPPGPLGLRSGTVAVRSVRSAYEKEPWKDLPSLEGVIESEFVYPIYLGERILPYRALAPAQAVLPWERGRLMTSDDPRLDQYPGLAQWWRKADELWHANRSSERLSLTDQIDFRNKLSAQHPIPSHRIVYNASGMHISAARVENPRAVIDNSLYWATVNSSGEALYLCAILNAAATTQLVRPLMSYGKDERHIHKHIWHLPIPNYDPSDDRHSRLATLAAEVEYEIDKLDLNEDKYFVSLRQHIRAWIKENPKGQEIEDLVIELLS